MIKVIQTKDYFLHDTLIFLQNFADPKGHTMLEKEKEKLVAQIKESEPPSCNN